MVPANLVAVTGVVGFRTQRSVRVFGQQDARPELKESSNRSGRDADGERGPGKSGGWKEGAVFGCH